MISFLNSITEKIQQAYQAAYFGAYGYRHFTQQAFLRQTSSYKGPEGQEDLSGKVVLVTGANAGLGKVVAQSLAQKKAIVYMLCRNEEAGVKVAQAIRQSTGNPNVYCEKVDMSSPSQIKAFIKRWGGEVAKKKSAEAGKRIDILINNAGVLLNERQETADGLEVTFATNTLGPYVLTEGLLREPDIQVGRVITVSSGGAYTAEILEGSGVETWKHRPYDGPTVYAQSKRAEIYLTQYWGRKYPNVLFYSMHPGWADTPGVQTSLPAFRKMMATSLRTPEQGADTIIWAATVKETPSFPLPPSGSFLFDRAVAPVSLFSTRKGDVDQGVEEEVLVKSILEPLYQRLAK